MKKPLLRLWGASLIYGMVPVLIHALPYDFAPFVLLFFVSYVFPPLAFWLPFRAADHGVNPYLAFFPPLLCLGFGFVLMRFIPVQWVLPLSFFISVFGASAGAERHKRR